MLLRKDSKQVTFTSFSHIFKPLLVLLLFPTWKKRCFVFKKKKLFCHTLWYLISNDWASTAKREEKNVSSNSTLCFTNYFPVALAGPRNQGCSALNGVCRQQHKLLLIGARTIFLCSFFCTITGMFDKMSYVIHNVSVEWMDLHFYIVYIRGSVQQNYNKIHFSCM